MRARLSVAVVGTTALTVSLFSALTLTPAHAVQASQPIVVSAVPATNTPDVQDGSVQSIAQVGPNTYLGGPFTQIANHGSSNIVTANNIAAFNTASGALVSGFSPAVNGEVDSIIAGPTPNTLYIAGLFTTVDGVSTRVALLNATTGAMVAGWNAPAINNHTNRIVLSNGRLFVGGDFTRVGTTAVGGLVALNPTTGAVLNYPLPSVSGHHDYLTQCTPNPAGGFLGRCADGTVGVKALDINPAGTQMAIIGNFTTVGGLARDQVALITLGANSGTVQASWNTDQYTAECFAQAFDYDVRNVQYSPDGSYFVVVSTGRLGTNSDGTNASCDTADRFNSNDTGADVQPQWKDFTGSDSLFSIAITGTVVYVGGHWRWMNDTFGADDAEPGAVPRPGVAALDPQNGLPLSWDPGRNPRGKGAMALLATADGLYVGSDTNYIGNRQYLHEKIAYFPLAGGQALAPNTTGTLPGNIDLVGGASNPSGVRSIHWDGSSTPGAPTNVNAAAINPSTVRGAFDVSGNVYYASTDGNFYQVPFNGNTFGSPTAIDPYDDPRWDNVQTGSHNTYQGVKSNFYGELGSLTSLFYDRGRIYYTLSGHSDLYWRWFETDDGVVGADEFTATNGIDWSNVAGAFLTGGTLYFANASDGHLNQVGFGPNGPVGAPSVADTTQNWASDGAFVVQPASATNQPPTASFKVNCSGLTCSVDGSASKDPDGSITSYSWSWGDGTTTTTAGPTAQHTYPGAGSDTIALTVTDNGGLTGSTSHGVTVGGTAKAVAYGGATSAAGNKASLTVSVPSSASAGDALLLFDSFGSRTTTATVPAGWTQVGTAVGKNQTTAIYERVATAGDLGSNITVTYSAIAKGNLVLADYTGTDPTMPVAASASANTTGSTTTTAPALNGLAPGAYALSYWADRSSTTTSFTPPAAVTRRVLQLGSGNTAESALLGDSAGQVGPSYPAQTATTNDASSSSIGWSIALAPNA